MNTPQKLSIAFSLLAIAISVAQLAMLYWR
jgi:hypothetical protein